MYKRQEEWKDRKSGKYVGKYFPHYHLFVWGVPFGDLMEWTSKAWWEACGKLSEAHLRAGTKVERLRDHKQGMVYGAKYIAKADRDAISSIDTGRAWGWINFEGIPFVRAITMELDDREAVQLIRYMKRRIQLRGNSRRRAYRSLSIRVDPTDWFFRLDDLLYPY